MLRKFINFTLVAFWYLINFYMFLLFSQLLFVLILKFSYNGCMIMNNICLDLVRCC